MKALNSVDIIIPIYNAYDDLTKCIESVYQLTDLNFHRLILINDSSSDPRILPYLNSIQGGNIIVIHNDVNKGFSASVNIGMHNSDHDVILLNSDTIVTSGWIDKIYTCAYSEEEIVSVTPLSNSATLASVPVFGVDNHLPTHVTIERMAEIVERCSLRKYPRIPVAVGFCMFIKRLIIDSVGYFDEDTFGRGYGEENDFCYRAELYGYKHVLCDDTFIYHKGTGSFFNEEKEKLIQEHIEILEDRYPAFMSATHHYCMENPHQFIRDNINIYLNFENGKKNLLYVLHADIEDDGDNSIGGTQLHVRDLTEEMVQEYNIFVVAPIDNMLNVTAYIAERKFYFNFNASKCPVQNYYDSNYRKIISSIINAFSISLVHIHHIQGLSLDFLKEAHKLNIPLIVSIHDFFYICPTIFLCDIEDNMCINGYIGNCKKCLKAKLGISDTVDYIEKWRKESHNALAIAQKIIFPSNSAYQIFMQYYPDLSEKCEVIQHGLDLEEYTPPIISNIHDTADIQVFLEEAKIKNEWENRIAGWAFFKGIDNRHIKLYLEVKDRDGKVHYYAANKSQRLDVDYTFQGNGKYIHSGFEVYISKHDIPTGNIEISVVAEYEKEFYRTPIILNENCLTAPSNELWNIAFIGGLSPIKGSHLAYEMIKSSIDINWYIFGNIASNEQLYNLEQKNLYKMGLYQRNQIVNLLQKNNIDLVCILSKCSETFCYTLSESVLAGIPVLALDIGALGERVKELKCGWLMPVEAKAPDILLKIREIQKSKEYDDLKCRLKELPIKGKKEMAENYRKIYQDSVYNGNYDVFDAELIFNSINNQQLF